MDKKAIKTFAIESRKKLIEEVKYQASLLGITAKGIAEPVEKAEGIEVYNIGASNPNTIYDEAIKQRKNLVKRINEKGFDNVVEEVAYTWFNRIIAIRFMEVNDYLPTRVRVLSSQTEGKIEPDIVTEAPHIDLNFTEEEIGQSYQLKNNNKLDELFRLLFIKQCNKLNEILPELFEKTADYTELLLSISFTNEEGVVRQLIDNISEEDFTDQVEIIGWLYQYYISERKDQVINIYKGNVKKEDIPAATQLFTPNWIVKYMVDNSLGRYWIERNPNSALKEKLEYYFEEAEQTDEFQIILNDIRTEIKPEEITFLDPCMGSGHILVYAFDVFVEIYRECGYSEREISELILKNNIFGLDVDDRAHQLAYFAVMMKARSYSRRVLFKNINPNVYSMKESRELDDKIVDYIVKYDSTILNDLIYLKSAFENAKEFGSLIELKNIDFDNLESKIKNVLNISKNTLSEISIQDSIREKLIPLLNQSQIVSKKYDIVVTNPPYLNKMDKTLKEFAKANFKDYSRDLFSMFIYRNFKFCKEHGYSALMTPFVWMFIKTYKELREHIINEKAISSLIQLEYSAFSEATVPICTFVLYNGDLDYNATYLKLSDFTGGMEVQNQKTLEAINDNIDYKYFSKKDKFSKIPGVPIAYWAKDSLVNAFMNGKDLSLFADAKQGLATADNNRFLRLWHEVNINNCGFGLKDTVSANKSRLKWFPYNKGGDFKKWYGNQEYLVNWENDGYEIKNFKDSKGKIRSRPQNTQYYFHQSLSWSKISSGSIAFRFFPKGFIFDVAGCSVFTEEDMLYLLGFLNSEVCKAILSLISPTLNYEVGHISSLPIIFSEKHSEKINQIITENIAISKTDWDSFETSWNFKNYPLLKFKNNTIKKSWDSLKEEKQAMFFKLKNNEIELNKIFIDIYNVNEALSPKINDKYVTLSRSDLKRDIINFISYAVGCMLGRYSLEEEGLTYAGGQWDPSKYSKFIPDDDNIIPILDTEYFEDDIVGRFVEFVKVTFGEETLEENLDFIAKALKKKGNTRREVIRNYFLTDFYKDHVKTYKKHPIYWLFDSGRNNGFKALIYMHRYEGDLVARVRTDYLHKTQKALETAITHNDRIIETSTSASEKSKAVKAKNKLVKQLEETKKYDEALAHVANQKIEIDLDDGVKVNYAKFQGVEVSSEGQKARKIDLLKKI